MESATKTVAEIMSPQVEFVDSGTSLVDAAKKMRELDCGFLPISDAGHEKLLGVITDRDIVLRAVAEGRDPEAATVEDVKSSRVLYCYKTDRLDAAANSMHDQQVHRLVVLDNSDDKKLCGVITLNDIVRHKEADMAITAAEGIAA